MEFGPFTEEYLPAAARLLAQRHRAHREAEPLLPDRFEKPDTALKAIEAIWQKREASGVAAMAGGRLAGFMMGTSHDDALRGRHVWIPLAGHAIATEESAELYRDLYAVLAEQWVRNGHFYHLALVPASDAAALDAWFRLTFAHEQAHGLRSLGPAERPSVPEGLEVRRATPDDFELIMAEGADLTARHQVGSPCFGICLPEARVGWEKGWAEMLADANVATWLVLKEGRLVAIQSYDPAPASDSDLMIPDRCVYLEVASTRPEMRGLGLGRLLTALGFAAAYEAGFTSCLSDWRVANLLSSRFWPRQGFRPVVYRLSRRIDPRIAWAR